MAKKREIGPNGEMFDVGAVLSGAQNAGLARVVVIAQFENGEMYVASSLSTPETLVLINAAPDEIERLASEL